MSFLIDFGLKKLAGNSVTVLAFHKVPKLPDDMAPYEHDLAAFIRVLDFVRAHYPVLPLSDAIKQVQQGSIRNGAVSITFDDGYADWLDGVVPALLERQLPATFFLTTGQFEGAPLWHERIRHIVRQASAPIVLSLPGAPEVTLSVATLLDRQQSTLNLEQSLKYMPLLERHDCLAALEAQTGCRLEQVPHMSAADVRTIHNKGFSIGAHTVDHPILSAVDSATGLHEIGACKEFLQGLIGAPVTEFAYPNGRKQDFTAEHVQMVEQCGYKVALTTENGIFKKGVSHWQVPRFTPWGETSQAMSWQMLRNTFLG
ncbi:MAG TPA: polysaccharide deacetylase family protein [Rhodocyclaceae bacterium]|nr:polysaccharide deacetylase family protein [Rhodocyclaceae bacterium]